MEDILYILCIIRTKPFSVDAYSRRTAVYCSVYIQSLNFRSVESCTMRSAFVTLVVSLLYLAQIPLCLEYQICSLYIYIIDS